MTLAPLGVVFQGGWRVPALRRDYTTGAMSRQTRVLHGEREAQPIDTGSVTCYNDLHARRREKPSESRYQLHGHSASFY